jgi:predicted acyltransferase
MAGARVHSLDLLRGAAIVGMVLVNQPAVGPPYLYRQLTHSPWNGWTFADTVFPVFLFVVGAAMAFSRRQNWWRRAAILFAVGLALNALPLLLAGDGMSHLRIMGVLQRIAIAGLLAALISRRVADRHVLPVAAAMLLATWAVLAWVPVPGHAAGTLTPDVNLPGWLDRHILGIRHMYPAGGGGYDPEGLFGCIPAAAGVLIGFWAGQQARAGRWVLLALGGAGGVVVGQVWSHTLPINKRLWTPSFVVFMSGLALLALVALHLFARRALPLRVVGANPFVVYVGSETTGEVVGALHHTVPGISAAPFTYWVWWRWLEPAFGGKFGNLVWAAAVLAVWWAVAAVMWERRWLISV